MIPYSFLFTRKFRKYLSPKEVLIYHEKAPPGVFISSEIMTREKIFPYKYGWVNFQGSIYFRWHGHEFTLGLHLTSPYDIFLLQGKGLFSNESFGEFYFCDFKISATKLPRGHWIGKIKCNKMPAEKKISKVLIRALTKRQ